MMEGAPPPMMGGARKRRRAVEWADLPPDILLLISQQLNSTWDFVRFRGVCSSWRSAANSDDRPPQVPSLLLPYDRSTAALSFLDLTDRRIHTIIVPEARWKQICGTPHGWLVLLGDEMISNIRLGEGAIWRVINMHDPVDPTRTLLDLAYFGGTFYVVDCYKGIAVYDPATDAKIYCVDTIRRSMRFKGTHHLVETSGDLLLLHRKIIGVKCFEVLKLDRSNGRELKWVRIDGGIGGRTLFLSCNHTSISLSTLDFTRSEIEHLDLIFFAGDGDDYTSNKKVATISISNIASGSSFWEEPHYWQSSRAQTFISDIATGSGFWDEPQYWQSLTTQQCLGKVRGLTWLVPNPF